MFAANNTYNVSLTVTDDRGGFTTVAHLVTASAANALPVAHATVSCVLMTCSFDGTASSDSDGTIASYAWKFGDGTTATTATASHAYTTAGTWPVTLTVTDNVGGTGSTSALAIVAPASVPSVLATDTFTRTLANAWGSADLGGAWAVQGTAANYRTTGTAGAQHVTAAGGNDTAYLSGVKNSAFDITTRVSSTAAGSATNSWVTVVLRKVSTNNEYRLRVRFSSVGVLVAPVMLAGSSATTLIGSEVFAGAYAPNTFYRVRVRVSGTNPTTISAKVWPDGTPEPSAWLFTRTDSTVGLQAAGVTGLNSYRAASSTPVDFVFDDYVVRPINLPPVAAFAVNCVARTCNVDASASTDDGSITAYRWSFGDGTVGTGVTTARKYVNAGQYTITLTVSDNVGVKTVLSKTVTVS
jgi:PKD repeat protein